MIRVKKKSIARVKIITAGALSRLIASFSNLLISLCIIRITSPGIWGEVVYFTLFFDLSFAFISWGHSPYLAREFSLQPKKISEQWFNASVSRSLLLVCFVAVILLYPFPATFKLVFLFWGVGRFIYQSFEPITEFERNYRFSILTELIALAIVLLPIVLGVVKPDIHSILILLAASFVFRSIVSLLYYRKYIPRDTRFSIDNIKGFLISAFPFFLLTFSGMLQQRIDLFFLALFTEPVQTGQYQIFLNLLLLNHVGASLLLSPFAKNIFRMRQPSLQRLESWFIKTGFMISFLSIALIYGVVKIAYGFELSVIMYVMGYFYIFMFYLYLLKIYNLRKNQQQSRIAIYAFAGCGINLIFSLLFTPRWGIEGAMFAGLMTQIAVVILYYRKKAAHQMAEPVINE